MKSHWNDTDAQAYLEAAGANEADRQLALRVYTSRLIGQVPDLVMHGGGNTSVKVKRHDLLGRVMDVLHVKGSGWDLGSIESAGLPGVRMAPLFELRALEALSDEDMVNIQRNNLLDSTAPNPSVETLLHAYLPHTFVDHTHATAMLALANLPEVEDVVREIFGTKVVLVPYVMPGFALAKLAAETFEAHPDVEGMLLVNHGHFTFGGTARESYERMIAHVSAAEDWFEARAKPAVAAPKMLRDAADVLPALRGAIAAASAGFASDSAPVIDLRSDPDTLAFLERPDIGELAARGVATPDHVIRTKAFPLLLNKTVLANGRAGIDKAIRSYTDAYTAYFDRQNKRAGGHKKMLRPTPNLAWIPGLGLAGLGANADAARIAADLGQQTLTVMAWAEPNGGFYPIGEDDTFDMEYWSLEQAKLGKAKPARHHGKIVLVTGGAGAIGLAVAKAFKAEGANVFLVDRNEAALDQAVQTLGDAHGGFASDLTAEGGAAASIAACIARFGGLDILVSNAGAAWTGEMASMDDTLLRTSFELNFFAHHKMAQAAAEVFRAQGTEGQMLFNVSKQAVNPGKGFGAYGLPKASLLFLVKQLALELGEEGVRVNGINADRIRSGLLTDDFIAGRAKSRNIDADTYMAGNLLKKEVEARHVADAFVALSLAERTTAHIMTVDGGNIEASLR